MAFFTGHSIDLTPTVQFTCHGENDSACENSPNDVVRSMIETRDFKNLTKKPVSPGLNMNCPEQVMVKWLKKECNSSFFPELMMEVPKE